MKIRIRRNGGYGEKEAIGYYPEQPDQVAHLATTLIERWGLVTGREDGEDSAGRQKLRRERPEEIVERAFDIAEEVFRVARARGHLVAMPDLNELNAELDAESDKAEAEKRMRREAARATSTA